MKSLLACALLLAAVVAFVPAAADRADKKLKNDNEDAGVPAALNPAVGKSALSVRIGVETLRNPFWYAEHGYTEEAKQFWDKDHWDRVMRGWADEGYNHLIYWVEPWNKHAWQTFLVRHQDHPEARELTAEQSDKVTQHVAWIFGRAHELGLKNLLFSYFIVATPAFAKAHGMDDDLPVSASVDFRHNLEGARPERSRAGGSTAWR